MLQLACRDLGMDCDHVVHGESVSDVKQKAMVHATEVHAEILKTCLLYTSPSPRDRTRSRMPSSA